MKIIILAGGSGTRLWPLSRTYYPKQFMKMKNMEDSLFQMTMKRSLKIADFKDIYIVANKDHINLITGQIGEMGFKAEMGNILLEPQAKNTLPAIYYAVKEMSKECEDDTCVFSSDHLIEQEDILLSAIKKGKGLTDKYLITFGIKPTSAETGFGYIKTGDVIGSGYLVEKFVEKPDAITAEKYVNQGYLWNSGMFMFNTKIFKKAVRENSPDVYEAFKDDDTVKCYNNTPQISIDYGIMEKASNVAVMPVALDWKDLGSFSSFYNQYYDEKDENNNVHFNSEILLDSKNNLVYSEDDKAIGLIDVNDLIIVDEKDALLICDKNSSERVKEVVSILKDRGDERVEHHLTDYRPWGAFTVLQEDKGYKVKKLLILPDKRISTQLHYHRSEHWIVVAGTANVFIDGEEHLVRTGESTFIEAGQTHRLSNPGKLPLIVIEVQCGDYLEEDDIVRFEDDYGRI